MFSKRSLLILLVVLAVARTGSASLKQSFFKDQQHLNHIINTFEATVTTNDTTTPVSTENSNTTTENSSSATDNSSDKNATENWNNEEFCTSKFLYNLTLIQETTKHSSQCGFAKDVCPGDVINWFGILFCYLKSLPLFILVSLVAIYAIFVFTSATVDEFIAEGITAMTEAMKLSDAMAAVTLIALANGAGDVITALVASGSDGGVSYNIGSLYGAGFFVAACVIALTIRIYCEEKQQSYIQLDKSLFFRDILIYVIATIVTIAFAFTNFIRWWQAVIYLVIYFVLVIIVAIQDKYQRDDDLKQKLLDEQKEKEKQTSREEMSKVQFKDKNILKKFQKNVKAVAGMQKIQQTLTLKNYRLLQLQQKEEEREKEFGEQGVIGKFTFVIDFIPKILRTITMMPASVEAYDKYLIAFWPLGGFIFFFWAFKLKFKYYIFAGLPISIILTIILWYYCVRNAKGNQGQEVPHVELKRPKKKVVQQKDEDMPVLPTQKLAQDMQKEKEEEEKELEKLPRHFLIIQIVSAITGLVWCFITISILMDLLNCFIVIFGLNNTFMGLTILGIGNALPDALTTLALARQGYALMGIIGGYSGQLFGLLVGFGIAQLKTTLISGKQDFDIFKKPISNLLDIIALFVTLITLIVTIIYGSMKQYRFDRTISTILLTAYILFFIVACIIQVYYIMTGQGK